MTVQLTIVGLNQVGGSIGLAIRAADAPIQLIGCDSDTQLEQKAVKLGAVDKTIHNLSTAVDSSDIVVLCLPADEVRKTLEQIGPRLKSGAVVLETSALKGASVEWATGNFSEDRHILAFTPTINPDYLDERETDLEHAHADLFKNSVILIGSTELTDPDAVKLAADLSALLGAKPYFSDLVEAEGLTALVHHLPQLSAVALIHAMEGQPGWREARKIGSRPLVKALTPLQDLDERKDLGQAMLLSGTNITRVIDLMVGELNEIRDLISSQDADGLKRYLETAVQGRESWLKTRLTSGWESTDGIEMPSSAGWLGKLFGQGRKTKDSSSTGK